MPRLKSLSAGLAMSMASSAPEANSTVHNIRKAIMGETPGLGVSQVVVRQRVYLMSFVGLVAVVLCAKLWIMYVI